MKYIALEELQKYIIHDGCDEGCGYIDERDIAAIPTVDLDKIRAEIEQMPSELTADGRRMIRRGSVFRIIDKYKASPEEADGGDAE